jgi:hypothetical protein
LAAAAAVNAITVTAARVIRANCMAGLAGKLVWPGFCGRLRQFNACESEGYMNATVDAAAVSP